MRKVSARPRDRARFWAKVDTDGYCWEWTASKDRGGYGRFSVDGRQIGAHRYSYLINRGPIAAGLHVMHECDNPGCVTPDRLYLGTPEDNMRDKALKGRCHNQINIRDYFI